MLTVDVLHKKAGLSGFFAFVPRSPLFVLLVLMLAGCQVREDTGGPFEARLRSITPENISISNQKLSLERTCTIEST